MKLGTLEIEGKDDTQIERAAQKGEANLPNRGIDTVGQAGIFVHRTAFLSVWKV
jgi:hypothetical protein